MYLSSLPKKHYRLGVSSFWKGIGQQKYLFIRLFRASIIESGEEGNYALFEEDIEGILNELLIEEVRER